MSTTSSASRRPFGKPALSPPITPKRFSVSDGGTPRLIFSVSAGTASCGDPRHARDAGQQRLDDVRAVGLLDPEVEQLVQDRREVQVQRVLAEVLQVVRRLRAVELVLLPERDDDLVDQRVAQPRDLHPLAARSLSCARFGHLQARGARSRPTRRRPRWRRPRAGDGLAVARHLRLGDLQDDRVHAVAGEVVLAAARVAGRVAEVDRRRTSRRGRRRTGPRAGRRTPCRRRAACGSPGRRPPRSSGIVFGPDVVRRRPAGRSRASASSAASRCGT